MIIPPAYSLTPDILNLISKIEANRILLESIDIPEKIKKNIQRNSTLRSSLFSARIEGNPLTVEDFQKSDDYARKKEVFNILSAVGFIQKNISPHTPIDKKTVLTIHEIVMDGLASDLGKFRKDPEAIFNEAGVAVYFSPPPGEVENLMARLLSYITVSSREVFPIITAFVSHLVFEKIHPFIDGNGRVGRLLVFAVLNSKDWRFPVAVPFEEYLDDNRNEYYHHLDRGMVFTNAYLVFMLEAFLIQSEKIKKEIIMLQNSDEPLLPPRQLEIFRIIREQRTISFDSIHRRFLKVAPRTLRYDLLKLQEKKLIIKIGSTKGSYYSIPRNEPS